MEKLLELLEVMPLDAAELLKLMSETKVELVSVLEVEVVERREVPSKVEDWLLPVLEVGLIGLVALLLISDDEVSTETDSEAEEESDRVPADTEGLEDADEPIHSTFSSTVSEFVAELQVS
jgi:hypothetical protein